MELEKNLKNLEELSNKVISSPNPATLMAFQKQIKECQHLLDKNANTDNERYFQSIIQKEALRDTLARLQQQELLNELEKIARKSQADRKDDTKTDFDQIASNVLANMDLITGRAHEKLQTEARELYRYIPPAVSSTVTEDQFVASYQQQFITQASIQEARAEFVVQAQAQVLQPTQNPQEALVAFDSKKALFAVAIDRHLSGAGIAKVITLAEILKQYAPDFEEPRFQRALDESERLTTLKQFLKAAAEVKKGPQISEPAPSPAPLPPAPKGESLVEPAAAPSAVPVAPKPEIPKGDAQVQPAPIVAPKPPRPKPAVKEEEMSIQYQIEKAAALGQQEKQERLIDKVERNTGGKDFYSHEQVLTTEKEVRQRESKELYNPQAINIPLPPPRQEVALVAPAILNINADTQPATARLREKNTPVNENTASNSMRLRPPPPQS